MNNDREQSPDGVGLVANGSAGAWSIAVDEALDDGGECSLEIDGPAVYLVFRLDDLTKPREALRFLQSTSQLNRDRKVQDRKVSEDELTLGSFGSFPVSLLWDNESFQRCFLIVGPRAQATLRVSLHADDIRDLIGALSQVVEDIPPA